MIRRLRTLLHAWLVALDQLAYVTTAGPAYLLGLGPIPSPYETISSSVGRHANDGWRWARVARWLIDRLFTMLVGSAPGHCQRSIVRADWITATLP
ncbi:hypothetical protein [uncultured Sphingomonas sp.]|uniref:hypothetical protein n=1 Tax=uncultured Sphingomonas sp. TaxID=158754 RepID=UPI0025F2610A|nr:hypothetical protein [uncultured Sphingomonas sp.]